MSLFGAAEQIVNDVVDTTEEIVDEAVDTAGNVADQAEQSGAATVVEIIVAIAVTTADGVAPVVNAGLADMKGKVGGAIQDATTGLRLMNFIVAMTAAVLAVVIAVSVQQSRAFADFYAAVLRLAAAIMTSAVTTKLQELDAQSDRLKGELSRLSGQITLLDRELERLRVRQEREMTRLVGAKSAVIQIILQMLQKQGDAMANLQRIGLADGSGDSAASEEEYASAAELARRLEVVVRRLSPVMLRGAAANPRWMLAHGALQRLGGHLQTSGANLLQARSALAVKQLKTPITLTPRFQKPVIKA